MAESDSWINATAPGVTPKINSIYDFSAEALGQLKVWLEQAGLSLPISNIIGFNSFTAQAASRVNTSEGTASTTYVDLATVGPTLTGVSPGRYVLFFGSALSTPAASAGLPFMGLSINGSTPLDVNSVQGSTTGSGVAGSTAIIQSISTPNSTIEAKYRTSNAAATASFNHRWLVALRYGNA